MQGKKKVISLWLVVQKGLTGTEAQLAAVADALKLYAEEVRVQTIGLNPLTWPCGAQPDLVLAAGRKAVLPALFARMCGHKVAFVQDPRWFRFAFHRIYAPLHDPAQGANVVHTDASPTRIGVIEDAPEPGMTALVIGGARKGDQPTWPEMAFQGVSLVTFSRRTPEAIKAQIRAALPQAEIYDPMVGGTNPYRDYLRRAETILVTNDSASMLSDACSTGRGVYIVPFLRPAGRLGKLARHLIDIGAARPYEGRADPYAPRAVLKDADRIAADIAGTLLTR